MRIALDCRALTHPHFGGYRSHTIAIVSGLQQVHHPFEFLGIIDREPKTPEVKQLLSCMQTVNVGSQRIQADFIHIPSKLRSIKPDLYVSVCNYAPSTGTTPVLAHMLDILLLQDADWKARRTPKQFVIDNYFALQQQRTARSARRICTLTQHSSLQIQSKWPELVDKVDVIGTATSTLTHIPNIRQTKTIVALGQRDTRKNVAVIFEAWTTLMRTDREKTPWKLLLIAPKSDWGYWTKVCAQYTSQRLDLVEAHNDASLQTVYSRGSVFVFPSLAEGFGLPPIEAMLCATPVVCSRAGALGEVTGDAAISIDPQRPNQLVDAILALHEDPELASQCVAAGLERASRIRAADVAQRLVTSIENSLS